MEMARIRKYVIGSRKTARAEELVVFWDVMPCRWWKFVDVSE
jgi:hypothetical protein